MAATDRRAYCCQCLCFFLGGENVVVVSLDLRGHNFERTCEHIVEVPAPQFAEQFTARFVAVPVPLILEKEMVRWRVWRCIGKLLKGCLNISCKSQFHSIAIKRRTIGS